MTYTFDTTTTTPDAIAGLSLVLRPIAASVPLVSLNDWFTDLDPPLIWVPLAAPNGLVKVMPVLSQPDYYLALLQLIGEQLAHTPAVEWMGQSYEVSGVEVESDHLYVLQVAITARTPLPHSLERAIHAQCLEWVAIADPELAEQLHQHNTSAFSICVKPISPRQIHLRISLLQASLLAPLLWGMSSDLGREITLVDMPCRLGKQIKIVASSRFEQLAQQPAQDALELEFLSPTSFKQGNIIQPFPLPELVFSGLCRRWNCFAPDAFQFPAVEWQGMVSAYHLKTEILQMRGGPEIGFQGWVKYRFPDAEQAKIAAVLAHFAYFAGVGRKTMMGMGQTCLKKR